MRENGDQRYKIPLAHEREQRILALAVRQYGHVTRRQLLDLGVSSRVINDRIAAGRLTPVHAGVYAVGPVRMDPPARAMAAVLACGPDAALSHLSAASLWGMEARWVFPLHVTAVGERDRPGICAHRSSTLAGRDLRRRAGIRVTSPSRTLLDAAPSVSERKLTRMVNDARRARIVTPDQLQDVIERNPRHRGAKLLAPHAGTIVAATASAFEDLFLSVCERFGLPTPRVNVNVNGYEVDALFEAEKVIVELDGWEFHKDRSAFTADRERDAGSLAAGYVTVRITWERLHGRPDREAARLLRILRSRRA